MKICWDSLEGIRLTKNGNFIRQGKSAILYKESCVVCGEEYLTYKQADSDFCSKSCSKLGSRNPAFGKEVSKETRTKHSLSNRGKIRSKEVRSKISKSRIGKYKGPKCNSWKGGVIKKGVPLFDTYSKQLGFAEETKSFINKEGLLLLRVRCSKCGTWFTPTINQVNNRIASLDGRKSGECRLYCSQSCKDSCEVYGKRAVDYLYLTPKELPYTPEELSVWSKEVLYRENYVCEICGRKAEHAHHIQPKKLEPGFALDPENGLAVCKECHYKYGHTDRCSTGKLATTICNK